MAPLDNDEGGVMVMCDDCRVWQHTVCMMVPEDAIPENYFCEQCRPDLHTDLLRRVPCFIFLFWSWDCRLRPDATLTSFLPTDDLVPKRFADLVVAPRQHIPSHEIPRRPPRPVPCYRSRSRLNDA